MDRAYKAGFYGVTNLGLGFLDFLQHVYLDQLRGLKVVKSNFFGRRVIQGPIMNSRIRGVLASMRCAVILQITNLVALIQCVSNETPQVIIAGNVVIICVAKCPFWHRYYIKKCGVDLELELLRLP